MVPYDVDAYINLGNVYNSMGKSDAVIVAFKQGLKGGVSPDVAYLSLAATYSDRRESADCGLL